MNYPVKYSMEHKKILLALIVYFLLFVGSAYAYENNSSLIIRGSDFADYINETYGYDITLMNHSYRIPANQSSGYVRNSSGTISVPFTPKHGCGQYSAKHIDQLINRERPESCSGWINIRNMFFISLDNPLLIVSRHTY